MTGFELWVNVGLTLGVPELKEIEKSILADCQEEGALIPAEAMVSAIAKVVLAGFVPSKRPGRQLVFEPTEGETLACEYCEGDCLLSSSKTTPHGRLCMECLAKYNDGDL